MRGKNGKNLLWKLLRSDRRCFILHMAAAVIAFAFSAHPRHCTPCAGSNIYPILIVNYKNGKDRQLKMATQEEWDAYHQAYREWYLKNYGPDFEEMDGHGFEHYCADLLRANGFTNVNVTQGSGDHGVDIVATKNGCKYAIQAKKYSGTVGNGAVQEVYSGRTMYECTYAVVLTNSTFTKSATVAAEKLGVGLWGKEELENMMIAKYGRQPGQYAPPLMNMTTMQQKNQPYYSGANSPSQYRPELTMKTLPTQGTFIYQDKYIYVEFIGCVKEIWPGVVFRFHNHTNGELDINITSLALNGQNIGDIRGSGHLAPLSTGNINFKSLFSPFPTMWPATITGRFDVIDTYDTIFEGGEYSFAFTNVQIT